MLRGLFLLEGGPSVFFGILSVLNYKTIKKSLIFELKSKISYIMVEIKDEVLKMTEIEIRYPNEWVVLGNPVFDGMDVLEGVVIAHHSDKRIASMEGGERRAPFHKVTLFYVGKLPPPRRIGLLRRVK
jgi:hypothetical protein